MARTQIIGENGETETKKAEKLAKWPFDDGAVGKGCQLQKALSQRGIQKRTRGTRPGIE